jgi:putative hydrolase of the HAD superfamily
MIKNDRVIPEIKYIIIFDLGNVILNFDHRLISQRLAKKSKFTEIEIYSIIFEQGLEERFDLGQVSIEEFIEEIQSKLGIDLSINEFNNLWSDIFWENEGVVQVIQDLKVQDYTLYLLSNTNELHVKFVRERFDILDLFDDFLFSYQIGLRKPDHNLFLKVFERSKLDPKLHIYIDDKKEYVDSALQVGMQVIVFESTKQLKEELAKLGVLFNST